MYAASGRDDNIGHTFCAEELSRDVDGFATNDNDLLTIQ
jgi:hypothetical protein